jgi:hypothetical protein
VKGYKQVKKKKLVEGSPAEEAGESAAVERKETAKGYQKGGVVGGSGGHHAVMNSRNVIKCEGMMGPRNP